MKLRSRLFQLTLGTVIPPIALAVVIGVLLIQDQHEAFRRGAFDRNRAFMTAVDAELHGHLTSLQALASSRALEDEDLRAFHGEARRVLPSQPNWRAILLADSSGKQLLSTRQPFGTVLPNVNDPASFQRVIATGLPAIGNLTKGAVTGFYGVPVRIPVLHGQSVAYVLTAVIDPSAFQRLVAAQQIRASWVTGLVDESGHFIARVPPQPVGSMASASFLAAAAAAPEGWYRGTTVERIDTYTAHTTSAFSGWHIGLAIPSDEVNAAAYHAGWVVGIGTLITVALALAMAWYFGRRISRPIADLAAAARSLGRESTTTLPQADPGIQEVRHLAAALAESSLAIRDRHALIEREQSIMRAADKAKDEFLAMLGHELRNPLSAVSNAAALLSRPELPPDKRAAAHAILMRQTGQLTRLVNDLLDVGRVVSGKIHLDKQTEDLSEITRAAMSALAATGCGVDHRIVLDLPEPAWVHGDRARLEQVVTNLVSNAVDHTPQQGTIRVTISKEDGFALLQVADSGAGFRAEDQEKIFDLFYQADKDLHRKGGLGIGLTLVKRLVEMHGGEVMAASGGPGTGATFTVRFPAAAAPPEVIAASAKILPAPPVKVLVVDDSEDVRQSMRLLLEAEGHDVMVAEDGRSGVGAALSVRPEIALLDIGMPGMNGYDAAREIRRRMGNGIALIAMTGYGQAADVAAAIDAGFDAHVVKPADLATLTALLVQFRRRPEPLTGTTAAR